MPERPAELYHFSEDPSITRFEPHIAATTTNPEPVVWAIDAEHEDLYYFPRNCPRVTFYAAPETTNEDVERFLGFTSARRVSAIESGWLPAMRDTSLYRYVFASDGFELMDEGAGYWVSRGTVEPVRVEPVGDLIDALVKAGIELRVMPSLWALYEAAIASTLGYSIIRWRNASPRPETPAAR